MFNRKYIIDSFMVHVPASYVSLPECRGASDQRPATEASMTLSDSRALAF